VRLAVSNDDQHSSRGSQSHTTLLAAPNGAQTLIPESYVSLASATRALKVTQFSAFCVQLAPRVGRARENSCGLLLTGFDHAVSCYNLSALISFHSVKSTDMAKLIIEIHGTQTLTCDACHYESIASIGKFCPQCHEQFTEVEYLSNQYRKKVCIERAANPSAAVKQKREP
jgi:hypothetical protein